MHTSKSQQIQSNQQKCQSDRYVYPSSCRKSMKHPRIKTAPTLQLQVDHKNINEYLHLQYTNKNQPKGAKLVFQRLKNKRAYIKNNSVLVPRREERVNLDSGLIKMVINSKIKEFQLEIDTQNLKREIKNCIQYQKIRLSPFKKLKKAKQSPKFTTPVCEKKQAETSKIQSEICTKWLLKHKQPEIIYTKQLKELQVETQMKELQIQRRRLSTAVGTRFCRKNPEEEDFTK